MINTIKENTINKWFSLFKEYPSSEGPMDCLSQVFHSKHEPVFSSRDIEEPVSTSIGKLTNVDELLRFTFWLTAFAILLHKYSNRKQLLLAFPFRRTHPYKLSFIRLSIEEDLTVQSLLSQVRQLVIQADDTEDYSWDAFVNEITAQGVAGVPKVFLSTVPFETNAPFDFFEVRVLSEQLLVRGKVDEWFCDQFAADLALLGSLLPTSLKQSVVSFQLRSPQVTAFESLPFILPDVFERIVEKYPHKIAVRWRDNELTYDQLNRSANRIANFLRTSAFVQPGDPVALILNRGHHTLAAIVGVLKSGGCYVPIDPKYPIDRILYVLKDSGARVMICDEDLYPEITDLNVSIFNIGKNTVINDQIDDGNPIYVNRTSDAAYVIYTSGSTGQPKGVVIEHHSVLNLLFNKATPFNFNEKDVWSLFHSYSFDFSVWEIFGCLLFGGKLVVIPEDVARDAFSLLRLISAEGVTIFNQTPSMFRNVLLAAQAQDHAHPLSMRYLIFGGEALYPALLSDWCQRYPSLKVVNMYGITEGTVHVTHRLLTPADFLSSGRSVIGQALPGYACYVVNSHLQIMPPGTIGELAVSGNGLARKYLNKEQLTNERFVPNQFLKGERLYLTGDLAMSLPNGDLIYFGRRDRQVKIRGYRIELEEIEFQINRHSQVRSALVQMRAAGDGSILEAYVVANTDNANQLTTELKSQLLATLPEYMVPSKFTVLDKFPVNFSGKIDLDALSNGAASEVTASTETLHPIVGALQDILRELLKLKEVSKDANFFSIGGDSLKVIPFIVAANERLQANLEVKDVYENPTIQLLAQLVDERGASSNHNTIQNQLSDIWKKILNASVPQSADFFSVGGDSLKVIPLVVAINKQFGTSLQVRDVYENPTIHSLSKVIGAPTQTAQSAEETALRRGHQLIHSFVSQLGKSETFPRGYCHVYPLTFVEKGMTYSSLLYPEKPISCDQFNFRMEIRSIPKFFEAFASLVHYHPILKTRYYLNKYGAPVKFEMENIDLPIAVENLNHLSIDAQHQAVREYLRKDLTVRYDFDGGLFWRMKLFRLRNDEYIVIWSIYHAMMDGLSKFIVYRDLRAALSAINNGHSPTKKLAASYKDHCAIELGKQVDAATVNFWRTKMEGYSRCRLPFNFNGVRIGDVNTALHEKLLLPKELTASIEALAVKLSVSPKSIFASSFLLLLGVLSYTDDVVAGVVTHNRPLIPDGENIAGCFLNTIPVRADLKRSLTVHQLIEEVYDYLSQARKYEIYLTEIVQAIGEKSTEKNPLFDCVLNFIDFRILEDGNENPVINSLEGEGSNGGFFADDLERGHVMTNTYCDFTVNRQNEGFYLVVNYHADFFRPSEMKIAIELFQNILSQFTKTPEALLESLSLRSPFSNDILKEFNNTQEVFDRHATAHGLFEKSVLRRPEAVALKCENSTLSYRELNENANRLARCLLKAGVTPKEVVGLLVRRDSAMIAGMLGILKTGAAYVPIDPQYPDARKQYIAENAQVKKILISKSVSIPHEMSGHFEFLIIEDILKDTQEKSAANLNIHRSTDLAYIIYTSGSTGNPKGVMVEHKSIVNLIEDLTRRFDVNENDRMLLLTSMCFDLSVYDIFGILAVGGQVVVATEDDIYSSQRVLHLIKTHGITFWDTVPSTMDLLVNHMSATSGDIEYLPMIRLVFLSGDWIPVNLPERLKGYMINARVISLGGATEACVWSNTFEVVAVDKFWTSIPYGKPISNTSFYVLDKWMRHLPVGVPGQLYIGGLGVARGYCNDSERTAHSFSADLLRAEESMYKTGDLGRIMVDGNMEFLGREDTQVKLKGYRIELGEIEKVLSAHPHIKNAVVDLRDSPNSGKCLVAYYISDNVMYEADIHVFCSKTLASYMVPQHYIRVGSFPLNANGKVQRKKLPSPNFNEVRVGQREGRALNAIEQKLIDVWKQLLGISEIGLQANFFELGGDSIAGMQMVGRLARHGVNIEIQQIFRYPTVESLGLSIKETTTERNREQVFGDAELSPVQQEFFEKKLANPNDFTQTLILNSKTLIEFSMLRSAFEQIFDHHDVLRSSFYSNGNEIVQRYHRDFNIDDCLTKIDLTSKPLVSLVDIVDTLRSSIDIAKAPLLKAAWVETANEHLLIIVCHHLIVDSVSWRIIADDLVELCTAQREGKEDVFPMKSKSYKQWTSEFWEYGNSKEIASEIEYWQGVNKQIELLKSSTQLQKPPVTYEIAVDDLLTSTLVHKAARALKANAKDIVLSALIHTIHDSIGQDLIAIDFESHGRENFEQATGNITRTLGWFTSTYPVVFPYERDCIAQVKNVARTLDMIPRHGSGYMLAKRTFDHNPNAGCEIIFNHLGNLNIKEGNELFELSDHKIPVRRQVTDYRISVTSYLMSNRLHVVFEIADERIKNVEHFCAAYEAHLHAVVALAGDLELQSERNFDVSPLQSRFWLLSELTEDASYNNQIAFSISGELNIELLKKALDRIVARHEILRTTFAELEGTLKQIIRRFDPSQEFFTHKYIQETNTDNEARSLLEAHAEKTFDLLAGPLWNVLLLQTGDQQFCLSFTIHHIISDGWSVQNLMLEWIEAYNQLRQGESTSEPTESRLQYKDYCDWLIRMLNDTKSESRKFWLKQLTGKIQRLNLPIDFPYPLGGKRNGHQLFFKIDSQEANVLKSIAKERDASLFMMLMATVNVLIYRYTFQKDIIIGSPVSGRLNDTHDNVIGLCANTILTRTIVDERHEFATLLDSIKNDSLDRYAHQLYPFDWLVNEMNPERDSFRNPFFDVWVVLQNINIKNQPHRAADLNIQNVRVERDVSKMDLKFSFTEVDGGIECELEYCTNIFKSSTVEGFIVSYRHLIAEIVRSPRQTIKDLVFNISQETKRVTLRKLTQRKQ